MWPLANREVGNETAENLVASGHKQLWQPLVANMAPMWLIESCGLRLQGTVTASDRKTHVSGLRRENDGHTKH